MREYVLTATFESGADAVADVFIDHPDLLGRALHITASSAGIWRVDRFVGPAEALDAVEAVYTSGAVCNECLGDHEECTITAEYEVVREGPESRVIYGYSGGGSYCHSVPFHAGRAFGDGLAFDARRRGNVYEWRVLVPGDPPIGDLFDDLRDGLPDGISLSLGQVGTPSTWGTTTTLADLPHEQREALEAAVDLGYYETPRVADLGEVADRLGLAKSTLRYRLRRAEAWLTETVVESHEVLGAPRSVAED
ncbi:helix-turn-helix domain-containing protein [Halorientalis halophila]|uniref:helix-turn-helix domain-containing protein n=1 Tax=Halorientalis halophila TaxID=3108499 RepID=UPI00300B14B6